MGDGYAGSVHPVVRGRPRETYFMHFSRKNTNNFSTPITDISQITFKSMAIVQRLHCHWICFSSATIRSPDFGGLAVFGSPFGQFFRHPDTPLPSFFTLPWISSAYAGAGLRRNSSTRRRISRKRFRGTATSANWNVTYLPWLTTFAPIFTSFSRSVVSDQCSTSFGKARVWCWLYPDSATAPERRPLSFAKPTFEPALRCQRIKFQTDALPNNGYLDRTSDV